MTRSTLLTQVLFALLCLQTAFLLGAQLPNAEANETEEENPTEASEDVSVQTETKNALVCRYFEMSEDEMKTERHGEINTGAPSGEIQKFLGDENAQRMTHSMDFEIGQSINGTPIYWVQICLSEA